jgi:large subunit ribosomal protein L10
VSYQKGDGALAITRAKKEALVARYKEVLAESSGMVVAQYTAMSVAETEQLRHKLREADGVFMITKNTLLKIALEESEWVVPDDLLKGQVGVAFAQGNLPGMSKALIEFAKDFEKKLILKGGIMGGTSVFEAGDVKAISEMPTLPEVQAQILGILTQPAQQLVNVVHAADASVVNVLQPAVSQVLNVLNAHIEQNLKGEGAAADAA